MILPGRQRRTEPRVAHLNDVNASYPGLLSNLIELDEELEAICVVLASNAEFDGQTLLEDESDVDGLVGCGLRVRGPCPHVVWWWFRRVFEISRFV